jgi:hypothetical protein
MKELEIGEARSLAIRMATQFDYFLIGGSAATLAFAINDFTGSPAFLLAVGAWACLLGAMALGLAHLSMSLRQLDLTVHLTALWRDARDLTEAEVGNYPADVHWPKVESVPVEHIPLARGGNIARQAIVIHGIEQSHTKANRVHLWSILLACAGIALLAAWKFCYIFDLAPFWA